MEITRKFWRRTDFKKITLILIKIALIFEKREGICPGGEHIPKMCVFISKIVV
jgi:hypothetical protein